MPCRVRAGAPRRSALAPSRVVLRQIVHLDREYDYLERVHADELRKATRATTEIEREFDQTDVLKGLDFAAEIIAWVAEPLRQRHQDERRYHNEAIACRTCRLSS
jgi:uncharacterized protein YoaH (UPF0181 family)